MVRVSPRGNGGRLRRLAAPGAHIPLNPDTRPMFVRSLALSIWPSHGPCCKAIFLPGFFWDLLRRPHWAYRAEAGAHVSPRELRRPARSGHLLGAPVGREAPGLTFGRAPRGSGLGVAGARRPGPEGSRSRGQRNHRSPTNRAGSGLEPLGCRMRAGRSREGLGCPGTVTLASLSLSGGGFLAGSCWGKVLSVDQGFTHRGPSFGAGRRPPIRAAAPRGSPGISKSNTGHLERQRRRPRRRPLCPSRSKWRPGLGDEGMSVRARGLDCVPGSFLLSQRPGSTRLEVYFRGKKIVNEDAVWLT